MSESTERFALPLIAVGQAQKEVSHNEALAALDLLMHPQVEAVGTNTPPATPGAGQCWIVGPAPGGEWAGQAGKLAGWTDGGWRFAMPREGLTAAVPGAHGFVRYESGAWVTGVIRAASVSIAGQQVVGPRQPAIGSASGGGTVDAEVRAVVDAILTSLRGHGLIAS